VGAARGDANGDELVSSEAAIAAPDVSRLASEASWLTDGSEGEGVFSLICLARLVFVMEQPDPHISYLDNEPAGVIVRQIRDVLHGYLPPRHGLGAQLESVGVETLVVAQVSRAKENRPALVAAAAFALSIMDPDRSLEVYIGHSNGDMRPADVLGSAGDVLEELINDETHHLAVRGRALRAMAFVLSRPNP